MGRNEKARKELKTDLKNLEHLLLEGERAFVDGISIGLEKAGLIVEDEAEERCPKYTGQLSQVIGHFRLEPSTAKLAKETYGEAADPSDAIWFKDKWNELVLGTQLHYAETVHSRKPFLTDALAAKAGEIQEAIAQEVVKRVKKKTK